MGASALRRPVMTTERAEIIQFAQDGHPLVMLQAAFDRAPSVITYHADQHLRFRTDRLTRWKQIVAAWDMAGYGGREPLLSRFGYSSVKNMGTAVGRMRKSIVRAEARLADPSRKPVRAKRKDALPDEVVRKIIELREQRIPERKVAEILGIHSMTVKKYAKGVCPYDQSVAKLQQEEIDLIIAYRLCGYSERETAKLIGISNATVWNHAKGVRPVIARTGRKDTKPVVVAEWRTRVRAGEARWSVAVDYDVCRQTVERFTKDIPAAPMKREFDRTRIAELIAQGLTDGQIATRLGCSDVLVWRVRHKQVAA